MAEVILVFSEPIVLDGRAYGAQVCGRESGKLWEGWIEFANNDEELRTARETTQPNREALLHWASGLSMTYLEGAFARALNPSIVRPATVIATPRFDGPAPAVITPKPSSVEEAVLDPYSVAEKGETCLRQKLGALRRLHLRNIVRSYELADTSVDLEALTEAELIELIVAAVMSPV